MIQLKKCNKPEVWDDFHKLYYSSDVNYINEDYEWKKNGLPFFAIGYYKMEAYEMLGLFKRYRYRKAARRKYVERWEKLGDELHNNVDNTMRKLWKQTLENKEFLEELEKKHKKVK